MDKRYIGVVVSTRGDGFYLSAVKTDRGVSFHKHKPKIIKTKFFATYKQAVKWLREISDNDLRTFHKHGKARYIRPVDLQLPQI